MTQECSVCFDTIDPRDLHRSSCGHCFHNPCITRWLVSKNTCPVCRHKVYEAPEEELEEEEERLLINYTKAYNDQLTNILHNFIADALEYGREKWTYDDELNIQYVHAYLHRKINGRNMRVFTLLQKQTIQTKSIFMGEIVAVQDISKPPKQITKKQNKIKKIQKTQKNFNYHRNRRNFVGKRFIRA